MQLLIHQLTINFYVTYFGGMMGYEMSSYTITTRIIILFSVVLIASINYVRTVCLILTLHITLLTLLWTNFCYRYRGIWSSSLLLKIFLPSSKKNIFSINILYFEHMYIPWYFSTNLDQDCKCMSYVFVIVFSMCIMYGFGFQVSNGTMSINR